MVALDGALIEQRGHGDADPGLFLACRYPDSFGRRVIAPMLSAGVVHRSWRTTSARASSTS